MAFIEFWVLIKTAFLSTLNIICKKIKFELLTVILGPDNMNFQSINLCNYVPNYTNIKSYSFETWYRAYDR